MVIQRARERRKRRRRWPRIVAAVLAIAVTGFGLAVWRLISDRERLSGFLVERARTALGLELSLRTPAEVELWPRPGVRLDGVRASVAGSNRLVAEIETVTASVPWRALWATELALGGVTVVHPRVQRDALLDWLAAFSEADAGPPEPLRWPSTDRALRIERLEWLDAANDATATSTLDLTIAPIAVGTPLAVDAIWHTPQRPVTLAIRGVPRDTVTGLLLDQFTATLASDSTPATRVRASGRASFASAAAWSVDARLAALRWPAWLLAAPEGIDATQRIALDTRFEAAGAGALGLIVKGTLGGSVLDARLTVPETVLDQPDRALAVQTLVRELRGSLSIDRLEIDGVLLEGIHLDASDGAAETPQPRG